ncbi:N-formylglutamate amidohydrolase [soil metagenome]
MSGHFVAVTCEHASNAVPPSLHGRFASADARAALASHRGWDIGVRPVYRALARGADFSRAGTVSRLVIDLNRSLHHRSVFSEFTRPLPPKDREQIVSRYYQPYREAVGASIAGAIQEGRHVVHLSVHTFTPVLHGAERKIDIAVLYDPSRPGEAALAGRWLAALRPSGLRLRRNAPYRGTADGFVTTLRRNLPDDSYLGLELEVNQDLAGRPVATLVAAAWNSLVGQGLSR